MRRGDSVNFHTKNAKAAFSFPFEPPKAAWGINMNQGEDLKLLEYYKKAAESAKTNPDAAVSNARKAAERVCKDIIHSAGKTFNQHASIESLLNFLQRNLKNFQRISRLGD